MTPLDYALLAQEAYATQSPTIGFVTDASCAIVREYPDERVVAFRGTSNLKALLADFRVAEGAHPVLGDIHAGFWYTWVRMRGAVLGLPADKPIVFTGHSLGAALAIIAAAEFAAEKREVAAVYGFAPPRVSPQDKVKSVLIDTPMWLYRNGKDVVTEVPLAWPQPSLLLPIGKPSFPVLNLRDHAIARYITALQDNGQTSTT